MMKGLRTLNMVADRSGSPPGLQEGGTRMQLAGPHSPSALLARPNVRLVAFVPTCHVDDSGGSGASEHCLRGSGRALRNLGQGAIADRHPRHRIVRVFDNLRCWALLSRQASAGLPVLLCKRGSVPDLDRLRPQLLCPNLYVHELGHCLRCSSNSLGHGGLVKSPSG